MVGGRGWPARALALVVVVACVVGTAPADAQVLPVVVHVITREDPERINLTRDGTDVVVAAPADNRTSVIRLAFTEPDAVPLLDAETCATWRSTTGDAMHQEGAVLRLRTVGGYVRAITVTKNVWGESYHSFNVHTWEGGIAGFGSVGTVRGQFDLRRTFATGAKTVKAFPWRLCARVVGNRVSFVVWPLAEPRPAWGDPRYGGTTTVPDEFVQPGLAGTYAGHVQPGSSIRYGDIVSGPAGIGDGPETPLAPEPPPTTAPPTTSTTGAPTTTTTMSTSTTTSSPPTRPAPPPSTTTTTVAHGVARTAPPTATRTTVLRPEASARPEGDSVCCHQPVPDQSSVA